MNTVDFENASLYYELYILDYLLEKNYITCEEYNRIACGCGTESRMFFVSKVINLGD